MWRSLAKRVGGGWPQQTELGAICAQMNGLRQPARFVQFVDMNDIIKPGDELDTEDEDEDEDEDEEADDGLGADSDECVRTAAARCPRFFSAWREFFCFLPFSSYRFFVRVSLTRGVGAGEAQARRRGLQLPFAHQNQHACCCEPPPCD